MDENDRLRAILVGVLGLIIVGGVIDIILDGPEHWFSFHVVFELSMVIVAMIVTTRLWLEWWRARAETIRLRAALEGFGNAADRQFDEWQLTPAEREVALLLLKGYSHKHIAAATGRSERTARQHAVAVYQKAGMTSRAELSAFFLEALSGTPPSSTGSAAPGPLLRG